jgi:hypothetical protein
MPQFHCDISTQRHTLALHVEKFARPQGCFAEHHKIYQDRPVAGGRNILASCQVSSGHKRVLRINLASSAAIL